MAWVRTVKEDDADEELERIYKRIRGSRGKISNIFLSQSLNPGALESHLDLYLRVMFGKGTLSRPQREMIAVVVSASNDCEYCVAHHSAAIRRYVDDELFTGQLAKDFRGAKLEPRERAMLDYASKLTTKPSSISQDDIETLRKVGFGDEEILHIALTASYFNFVNRLASGLGVSVEADEGSGYRY
ncbi:MAG: peroxidase-related enzyme [Thaumarchaeota archaeon]|nr:peroxidase-related enzyme [Nitrososphaerota archaeon]